MPEMPYEELGQVRRFSKDVDSDELKWHRDREDRIVTPLNKNDWMFQRDNCLPEPMDGEIRVARGEWHRVIKGTTDLEVRVIKKEGT
jgi:hypothetical protein